MCQFYVLFCFLLLLKRPTAMVNEKYESFLALPSCNRVFSKRQLANDVLKGSKAVFFLVWLYKAIPSTRWFDFISCDAEILSVDEKLCGALLHGWLLPLTRTKFNVPSTCSNALKAISWELLQGKKEKQNSLLQRIYESSTIRIWQQCVRATYFIHTKNVSETFGFEGKCISSAGN